LVLSAFGFAAGLLAAAVDGALAPVCPFELIYETRVSDFCKEIFILFRIKNPYILSKLYISLLNAIINPNRKPI